MSIGEHAVDRVEVVAPAKLNLALLVGPVRPDGFHEIASLMVPVTLADLVTVESTPGGGLEVVCDVAPGEDNLAAKLVRELEAAAGPLVRGPRDHRQARARRRRPGRRQLGRRRHAARAGAAVRARPLDQAALRGRRWRSAPTCPSSSGPGPQLAMGRGQVLKDVELPAAPLRDRRARTGAEHGAVYGWRDEDAEVTREDFVPRARLLSARARRRATVKDVVALVPNDLEPSVVARKPQVGELRAGCWRGSARGGHDRQRRRRVRRVRLRGWSEDGAGGRRPRPRLVRHRPAARAPRGPPHGGAPRPSVLCYSCRSRRASGRLAAPLPISLGRSQVVRHRVLVPASGGSNPPAPASVTPRESRRAQPPAPASR